MTHSDRWKWCNICLSRQDLLYRSLIHIPHLEASQYNHSLSLLATEQLYLAGWVPCCTEAERGKTTAFSLTPLQASHVDSSIPRLLLPWISIILFSLSEVLDNDVKKIAKEAQGTVALSVCWLVGSWYPQCNDRCPQTAELWEGKLHWIIQDRKPVSAVWHKPSYLMYKIGCLLVTSKKITWLHLTHLSILWSATYMVTSAKEVTFSVLCCVVVCQQDYR